MSRSDKWTVPLFILFFVISGAGLELSVFSDLAIVGIGIVYIIIRSLGKYTGASISSAALHCDKSVQKYLGITLFPQAGVALGMCITASELEGHEHVIKNVILFGVLVYELVGPLLTKIALTKSGDIRPKSLEVINRRAILLKKLTEK
jgi:Kef-type K+ transport system membrane component KefB